MVLPRSCIPGILLGAFALGLVLWASGLFTSLSAAFTSSVGHSPLCMGFVCRGNNCYRCWPLSLLGRALLGRLSCQPGASSLALLWHLFSAHCSSSRMRSRSLVFAGTMGSLGVFVRLHCTPCGSYSMFIPEGRHVWTARMMTSLCIPRLPASLNTSARLFSCLSCPCG